MSQGLEVAYTPAPEVYESKAPSDTVHQPPYYAVEDVQPSATPKPRVCGLRRPTFVLLLVIAFVVIAASVGGGVGGSLAVQNARSAPKYLSFFVADQAVGPKTTPTRQS